MATDFQERDFAGRKRSHGDFLTQDACEAKAFLKSEPIAVDLSLSDKENDVPFASDGNSSPPAKVGSASPIPTAPATTAQSSSAATKTTQPAPGEPPKKKRMTAEEKAAQQLEVENAKRKKAEEKEKKKREKEEAEKKKAEERAAKAAEKAEKDQLKKQRQDDQKKRKLEKEQEEAKKARSQMKLTNMFNKGQSAVKPQTRDATNPPPGAPPNGATEETSLYNQMFRPFFVKEHVRLASNPCELDEETREAKSKILDEYIRGERQHPTLQFNPLEALQIPYKVRRGRVYPSVQKIMAEFHDLSSNKTADATTESQNTQIRNTMQALKSVPVKSIKFKENVRPPYIGTLSGPPPGGKSLQKLARKPTSKSVLELNYDYESEAEWQDEEGEDIDDLDDEEEEGDMDEEMADFLDDSEDVGPARMVLEGGMEPDSSGLCWESYKRCSTQPKMYKYRLEFIHEPLEHHHSIDPFSTAYWAPPKSKVGGAADPKSASVSPADTDAPAPTASKSATTKVTPSPADAFQALGTGPTAAKKSQQPLSPAMQEAMKDLVRTKPALTKLGVIEVFASEHPDCARNQIKAAFTALFEKSGKVFKVRGE